MGYDVSIQMPDFDGMIEEIRFEEIDIVAFAEIIIDGMTSRILEGVTAEGEALDENSLGWVAQKLREGRFTAPLQYTGGLRDANAGAYVIAFNGETATIELAGNYRQIHVDLINISNRTGKNYKDWFGINQEDIDIIMEEAAEIIKEKLRRLF